MSLGPGALLQVRPVRKAFEQVADQLRQHIVLGTLAPGDRLPTEAELSAQFGVSRGTVREALRTLGSEGLISTSRGGNGGSFAAVPKASHLVQSLTGTIALMTASNEVSVGELLEARQCLEVPAAAKAAQRRTATDLAALDAAIPTSTTGLLPSMLYECNRDFHLGVVSAAGNRVLSVIAEPLFVTMQVRFLRERAPDDFWERVTVAHRQIVDAIRARDSRAAERAMVEHLKELAPTYEEIDREPGPRSRSREAAPARTAVVSA